MRKVTRKVIDEMKGIQQTAMDSMKNLHSEIEWNDYDKGWMDSKIETIENEFNSIQQWYFESEV